MARPDPNADDLRKKQLPQQEQEEEQELEQQEDQKQEQQRDAAQDQLGNQEIAAMLGLGGAKAGEAGQATDMILRPETADKDGADYGGDDAPADGPIEMEDLVRSWNPGTRRGQDAPKFVEQMPTGALEMEDAELLAELEERGVELREGLPDRILLSPEVVLRDPTPLARTAARLASGSLLHRTWAHLASPPASPLVDADGRLVLTRARVLALLALLAADGAAASPDPVQGRAFARAMLELAASGPLLDQVNDDVRTRELRLPTTMELVRPTLEALPPHTLPPGPSPSVEVIEHVRALLDDLAPHVPGTAWLVSLPPEDPVDPEDDPLGLDALLVELTGGKGDPMAGVYDASLEAAEKMAGACARLKTDAAFFLLAVVRVLGPQASPATLMHVAQQADIEVGKVLQLLVEIARAIRQRAVPPAGVRNGLRRAAKGLDVAFGQIAGWVAGVLVTTARLQPKASVPPLASSDALAEAWREGTPAAALPFVRSQARGLDGEAAVAFARAAAGEVDVDAVLALADRAGQRPFLARALRVVAVSAVARTERGTELARALAAEALAAGDDLSLAVASQIELDRAGDRRGAHLELVRRMAVLGPHAGRSLLLRHEFVQPEDAAVGSEAAQAAGA